MIKRINTIRGPENAMLETNGIETGQAEGIRVCGRRLLCNVLSYISDIFADWCAL
jgi:hypothetical protein